MTDIVKPAATWRKVSAAILDFFTIFFVLGYTIAQLTGNVTNEGFKLEGLPALVRLVRPRHNPTSAPDPVPKPDARR